MMCDFFFSNYSTRNVAQIVNITCGSRANSVVFHLYNDLSLYSCKPVWFNTLGLSLNLDKCKIMTFTRSRSPIMSPYFIHNVTITRNMNYVMDLGFKLTSNLDPTAHIEHVCCKALKTLGLVIRLIKDFRLESSLKTLFCALVRPILEYGTLILLTMPGKLSVFSAGSYAMLVISLRYLVHLITIHRLLFI